MSDKLKNNVNNEKIPLKLKEYGDELVGWNGDSIYHNIEEEWIQEFSHHKLDGSINYVNLENDTQTD